MGVGAIRSVFHCSPSQHLHADARMRFAYFRLLDNPGKIPALDGLRGIAILLVVLFHASESFVTAGERLVPLGPADLALPLYSGWMGVNLFFVLSGFLITHHLLRGWRHGPGQGGLRTYLLKRWLRIVPTYYVVLAIAALGVVPHHPIQPHLMGFQVAYHALFLQDYLPSSILGPFWSLGVEEKFYLVMPVVILAMLRIAAPESRLRLLLGIAAVPFAVRILMYFLGAPPSLDDNFLQDYRNPFHLNLDALFFGAACAWVAAELPRSNALWTRGRARAMGLIGVLLILVLMISPWSAVNQGFFYRVAIFPLTAGGMALVLLSAVMLPVGSSRILENPWLARAGRIAYPWYLTHVLVLHWLGAELGGLVSDGDMTAAARFGLFLPVFLAASILVALALHFAIEKPCLILKDRVGARPVQATSPIPADAA